MPGWAKWSSAIAACLVLVVGVSLIFGGIGGNAGSGGDDDLSYMYYVGPVLPLSTQEDAAGIEVTRNVNYDFSPYNTVQDTYEDSKGEMVPYERFDSSALVTDSYELRNVSGEDKTITLLYPFIGDMREWELYPTIRVDGEEVSTVMHPGPYSGGFEGVWGSNEAGTVNLKFLDSFDDYQTLLATDSYMNSAFDDFPELDQKVFVYRLHDFVYHTDNFDEHIIAFTMVLKKDIPYCYTAFTAYNILSEQVDDEGVIHQETEQFKIITTCPYYEENVSYTTIDNLLSITVNGVEVDTMPTTPGTYEVVIDYSELYVLFDVVEDYVQVWFADLVINSSRFSE